MTLKTMLAAAEMRAQGAAATEVDPEILARVTALPEASALDFFWLTHRQGADVLPLLLLMSRVVIARPADWDPAAIRREHESGKSWGARLDRSQCFACEERNRRRYLHHLIEVQHGGSNHWRNQVPLCFPCHQYLHPWLTDEPADHASATVFQSFAQVMGNKVRLRDGRR